MEPIVACATAHGRSGVAMIRLSGHGSLSIVEKLSDNVTFPPRRAKMCPLFRDGILLDHCIVIFMPGPNSFTGEDVLEISCHGNPLIVDGLIRELISNGARMARAGEFSRRAVVNGKMSLLRAEALHGLIEARNEEGIQLAQSALSGTMDHATNRFSDNLLDIAAELEARLDHPGEDLGYLSEEALIQTLLDISHQCSCAAENYLAARQHIYGARVAILGPVNVGKSSLFNHLVDAKRALVSDIPGTTRDVVEKTVRFADLDICFLDTAGARFDSMDPLEREGMALGIEMAQGVDLCLLVDKVDEPISLIIQQLEKNLPGMPFIHVGTHLDRLLDTVSAHFEVVVSNETRAGFSELENCIRSKLGNIQPSSAGLVALSQRQHALFVGIARNLIASSEALGGDLGPAVAAEEITQALERLNELAGQDVREQILDRVFHRFCIGK